MQLFLSGVTMGRTNMLSYLVVGKSVAVPRLKPHGCSLLGPAWEPDMSCTICAVFSCQVTVGSMTWEFLSTPPLCSPVSLIFCIWFHRNRTPDPLPCKFSVHVFKTIFTITICLNTNRFGEDYSVYSFQKVCLHIMFGGPFSVSL